MCKVFDSNLLDSLSGGSGVSRDSIFNELPTNLKILGKEFLCMIQNIHDDNDFWDEKGITPKADYLINHIKTKFNL